MTQLTATLNSTLAAAVGNDAILIDELRAAFFTSAAGHVLAMQHAVSDADWANAALRLKGLAASFGALRVMDAAAQATRVPRNAQRLAAIDDAIESLRKRG